MQLTTPEAKEYDTVFPGENWFFFWRTSPSLWESKLSEYQGPGPVFVPIFWGLHSENPEQYDFGSYRPETDLKKLSEIAKSVGKEIVFLLPLTPAPFLPNGGVPSYLARTLAIGDDGLVKATIDNDSRLNKMYSFFDPRVFQGYREFCEGLGRLFREKAIPCEIYGIDCHHIENTRPVSFFSDRSVAFQQGFDRYLVQMKEQGTLDMSIKDDLALMEQTKKDYSEQIKDLYFQSALESLSGNWSGKMNYAFIGSSSTDIFARSNEQWEQDGGEFKPLFQMVSMELIPSSVLLSPNEKKEPLTKALQDIVSEGFIRSSLDNSLYTDEDGSYFAPLFFFDLVKANSHREFYDKTGLINFLEKEYPWSFKLLENIDLGEDEDYGSKTRFFLGSCLGENGFNTILKLLMNGTKVFLDTAGLDEQNASRLHMFTIENDLNVEKINYVTPVEKIQLGEGFILTYNSDELSKASLPKKLNFWETILNYLKVKRLVVESDDGVFYQWGSRPSNAFELSYEEIRRLSLYNTTSYKKKAHIVGAKNFAFLKTVDQKNVEVKSTPIGIDVRLLPGASVSLDFGHYE